MGRARTRNSQPLPAAKAPPPRPRPAAVALPSSNWRTHLLPLVTIAAAAIVVYLPSLTGPFVYDDPNAITQSTLIRRLTPLHRFLTMSGRPISDFSYALNYAMAGYDTWPYHLTGMLLHAANAMMLYGIAWATYSTGPLLRRYGAARTELAWAAAALFAVHPLASETIAQKTGPTPPNLIATAASAPIGITASDAAYAP